MPKIKHTHKLKKHRFKSGSVVFFCALDCTYKISPALAEGKKSICWRCGEEFLMNEYSIRLTKPHCEGCHMPKGIKKVEEIEGDLPEIPEGIISHIEQHKELSLGERLQQALRKPTTNKINNNNEEEDI